MKAKLTLEQELEVRRQKDIIQSVSPTQLKEMYEELLKAYMLAYNMNRVYMLLAMGLGTTDELVTRFLDTSEPSILLP
jgi:hypothetical protein